MKNIKTKQMVQLIIVFALACLLALNFIIVMYMHDNQPQGGIEWNKDSTNTSKDVSYTKLPCFSTMVFNANETEQNVYIDNPKSNHCYMNMLIDISGDTIWSSKGLMPGDKYTKITITEPLRKSIYYDCKLYIKCYDIDTDQALNGGVIAFTLLVQ